MNRQKDLEDMANSATIPVIRYFKDLELDFGLSGFNVAKCNLG